MHQSCGRCAFAEVPLKALTAALKEVEPLNTELDNYAQANGYFADKGKKHVKRIASTLLR